MIIKNKMRAFLSIMLVLVCGVSINASAQAINAKGQAIVGLGNMDTKKAAGTTVDAVLAQPRLTAASGYVVTEFKVSIAANDKTEKTGIAYFGPYTIKGAELTDEVKTIMKKYVNAKLIFEDIKVMSGNQTLKGSPMTVICKAN